VANLLEVELAGMLSQIGCVAVPRDILEKKWRGESVFGEEMRLMSDHPRVGKELLEKIPRLEAIAEAIGLQMKPYAGDFPLDPLSGDKLPFISRLLKVVLDFDEKIQSGVGETEALGLLEQIPQWYDPEIFRILSEEVKLGMPGFTLKDLPLDRLKPGMIMAVDLKDTQGRLLLPKGQELSEAVLYRLGSYLARQAIEPVIKIYEKDPPPPTAEA